MITREMVLKELRGITVNNLFYYSENYLMTKPREGYETEHREAAEKLQVIEAWLKEGVK